MATLNRAIERGKPRSRLTFARRQAGLLFVLPSVLFMTVFFVVPAVMALWVSLHNWPLFGATKFIGLGNYIALSKDPLFWRSLSFTTVYAILITPPIFLLGFGMALRSALLTSLCAS